MLLRFFAVQVGGVDRATLLAARPRLLGIPDAEVRATLIEVVDGQLALREIGGR